MSAIWGGNATDGIGRWIGRSAGDAILTWLRRHFDPDRIFGCGYVPTPNKKAAGSCDPAAFEFANYVRLFFHLNALNDAGVTGAGVVNLHLLT
jgi:hypothetical protein